MPCKLQTMLNALFFLGCYGLQYDDDFSNFKCSKCAQQQSTAVCIYYYFFASNHLCCEGFINDICGCRVAGCVTCEEEP